MNPQYLNLVLKILKKIKKFLGYPESAYLWALSSAGAAWGVATACAQGWLQECKCSSSKNTQYYTQPKDEFFKPNIPTNFLEKKSEPILGLNLKKISFKSVEISTSTA